MSATLNVKEKSLFDILSLLAVASLAVASISAGAPPAAPEVPVNEARNSLLAKYNEQLKALQVEIEGILPKIDAQQIAILETASEAIKVAEAEANAAQQSLGKVHTAKALVDHAKGKWVGGAEKGIK